MAIQQIIDEDNIPYDGDGIRKPLRLGIVAPTSASVEMTIDAS